MAIGDEGTTQGFCTAVRSSLWQLEAGACGQAQGTQGPRDGAMLCVHPLWIPHGRSTSPERLDYCEEDALTLALLCEGDVLYMLAMTADSDHERRERVIFDIYRMSQLALLVDSQQ